MQRIKDSLNKQEYTYEAFVTYLNSINTLHNFYIDNNLPAEISDIFYYTISEIEVDIIEDSLHELYKIPFDASLNDLLTVRKELMA